MCHAEQVYITTNGAVAFAVLGDIARVAPSLGVCYDHEIMHATPLATANGACPGPALSNDSHPILTVPGFAVIGLAPEQCV